jgi:hypothetical protein
VEGDEPSSALFVGRGVGDHPGAQSLAEPQVGVIPGGVGRPGPWCRTGAGKTSESEVNSVIQRCVIMG